MFEIRGFDIYITQGDTSQILIEFDGEVPPDGTTAVICVKERPGRSPVMIEKNIEVENGELLLSFGHNETMIPPKRYRWDLRLVFDNGDVITPMEPAVFTILPAIGEIQ